MVKEEVFHNEADMEIEDIFALRPGLSFSWEIREVKFVQESEEKMFNVF